MNTTNQSIRSTSVQQPGRMRQLFMQIAGRGWTEQENAYLFPGLYSQHPLRRSTKGIFRHYETIERRKQASNALHQPNPQQQKLKKRLFGIDASKEISLKEYHLLVASYKDPKHPRPDEYFILYGFSGESTTVFGTGYITESAIHHLLKGKDWAGKSDINLLLETSGFSLDELLGLPFVHKLYHAISFWGAESVVGTDYSPMSLEEACEYYL